MTSDGRPTVGVVGSGASNEAVTKLAFETGREIARNNAVLICGGGSGVMEAACSGAKTIGGTTIGLLPGENAHSSPPNGHLDYALFTGLGQGRNQIIVLSSDVVIAVGGEWGTLSEIALAFKHDIPVILLNSWSVEGPDGQGLDLQRAASAKEAVAKALGLLGVEPVTPLP
ncbi:MAG: TIGR00725 family protein [Thermoanaerobaculia bacterium]|nr:TIGR00725 family protein [Thermoanaerobaculia bacterium]